MAFVKPRTAANGNRTYLGGYLGADGKQKTKAFRVKRDALRWAQEGENAVRSGSWTDPRRAKVTVGEVAEQWLRTRQVKPKTLEGDKSLLRSLILPRWGETRLEHVTLSDVKVWTAELVTSHGRPASPSRKRQAYQVLAAVLDLAVEDGRLPRNPARAAAGKRSAFLPRVAAKSSRRALTHIELETLARATDPFYAPLVRFLAYTGLRWGEATALRVSDIDLLRRRVSVERAVSEVNGELIYGPTKTHQARTVAVPELLRQELEQQLVGKGRSDLLFTTKTGAPIRNQNFSRRVWHPAVEAAGLDRLTPHELRHTAASLAVAAGANVKGVQRMLGHEDAAMTLNRYGHLFDSELDAVAERMDQAAAAALVDFSWTQVSTGDQEEGGGQTLRAV